MPLSLKTLLFTFFYINNWMRRYFQLQQNYFSLFFHSLSRWWVFCSHRGVTNINQIQTVLSHLIWMVTYNETGCKQDKRTFPTEFPLQNNKQFACSLCVCFVCFFSFYCSALFFSVYVLLSPFKWLLTLYMKF